LKVLVTGAAGFIGMHASLALLARGHSVLGADSLNAYYDPALKRARLERLRAHDGFEFRQMDLADAVASASLFEAGPFDRVLHLAAQAGVRYSLERPMAYVESNVAGFLNVLEGCRRAAVPHLLYASSSSVYGANDAMPFHESDRVDRPVSLYAATKRANELMAHSYAHLFGIPCTGLRLFTVYGPWGRPDMALFLFTRAMLAGQPIRVFNGGDMQRDFTYIDDVLEALVRLVEQAPEDFPAGEVRTRLLNVGHGSPVRLMDFVHALERTLGREAKIDFAPMQPGDVAATWASTDALRARIDYVPSTPVETGVAQFVAWYREYYGSGGGATP